MRLPRARIRKIQHRVLDWYAVNKRNLPWRETKNPYAILVSEVMLQQTQVSRVLPKYQSFLERFPTVEVLATSSPAAVIRAWQGLGYNRRALNLQRAARMIVERAKISPNPSLRKRGASPVNKGGSRGIFPRTVEELTALPGIGRYTAAAVATFAFGAIEPAVDTNVRRFLDAFVPSRRLRHPEGASLKHPPGVRTEADYYALARQLIPPDRPAEWLHAVMDYTSLVLRRAVPPQPRRLRSQKPPRFSRPGRSEPFIDSNRYLRGRVIDRLRVRAESPARLFRHVAAPIEVTQDRFRAILAALERDGMIELRSGHFRLPDA